MSAHSASNNTALVANKAGTNREGDSRVMIFELMATRTIEAAEVTMIMVGSVVTFR